MANKDNYKLVELERTKTPDLYDSSIERDEIRATFKDNIGHRMVIHYQEMGNMKVASDIIFNGVGYWLESIGFYGYKCHPQRKNYADFTRRVQYALTKERPDFEVSLL